MSKNIKIKAVLVCAISVIALLLFSCNLPDKATTRNAARNVANSITKSAADNPPPKVVEEKQPDGKDILPPENKDPVETVKENIVKLPLEPSDLQNTMYFGIRVLSIDEIDAKYDDIAADRRLTLRFEIPRGGTALKAKFGDADTEEESKKALMKQNLDVQISGMFITLLDNGNPYLKAEVSKDFQFMFITEDYITKPQPYTHISYVGTGLALNGEEYHANIPGGYNGPILPKLPKYPFEN